MSAHLANGHPRPGQPGAGGRRSPHPTPALAFGAAARSSGRPAGGRCALRVGPRGVEPGPMSERGEDERAELTNDDVATALKVLARVAADRTLLAEVDADTRTTLQRLAGEVARPDLKQRKKLQRALLRNERLARRARDEALRKGTGIQQLREAPVFVTPLPQLPPAGTDASGWWPRLGPEHRPLARRGRREPADPTRVRSCRSRASATSARRPTEGSTRSTISCAAPVATRTSRGAARPRICGGAWRSSPAPA